MAYYTEDDNWNWRNSSSGAEFANSENVNTIYIDVRRLGYVTFDGNNTIVTLADNLVIQHLELLKNGDAFTYGVPPTPAQLGPGRVPFPEPLEPLY
jgi:hypothetical protein